MNEKLKFIQVLAINNNKKGFHILLNGYICLPEEAAVPAEEPDCLPK